VLLREEPADDWEEWRMQTARLQKLIEFGRDLIAVAVNKGMGGED
jgi:hypothetical protein